MLQEKGLKAWSHRAATENALRLRVSRMAKLMRTFPELMLIVKARTKVGIIGQLVVQGCVGQCIGVMGFMLYGSESNSFASLDFCISSMDLDISPFPILTNIYIGASPHEANESQWSETNQILQNIASNAICVLSQYDWPTFLIVLWKVLSRHHLHATCWIRSMRKLSEMWWNHSMSYISVLFGDTGTHSISGNLYGAHGAR